MDKWLRTVAGMSWGRSIKMVYKMNVEIVNLAHRGEGQRVFKFF